MIRKPLTTITINTWSDQAREKSAMARRSKRASQADQIYQGVFDQTPKKFTTEKEGQRLGKAAKIARRANMRLQGGKYKYDLLKKHGYL